MSTIIDISEDLLALADLMEENCDGNGEISPDVLPQIESWFAELSHDRDRKLDNYGALIREKELRAASRREELERLAIRVRVDENQAEWLKLRLINFFDAQGLKKLETHRYRFSVCGNGGKQPMDKPDDPTTLPADLQKTVVTVDSDKLRAALESGREVPGAALRPRGRHLRIT